MTAKPRITHEDYIREETAVAGSERSFGFVFAAFCAVVGIYKLWNGNPVFWGWSGAAMFFATLAAAAPRLLRPLNIAWFKLGMLLHRVISPVVLTLMFFLVFTPTGLLMRLSGKRPLNLKFERERASYWIERTPPGPGRGSFHNQF